MPKDDLTFRLAKGSNLTYQEGDDNFNRLAYFAGDWVAGTYTQYMEVNHVGARFVCIVPSTTQEPGIASTDWRRSPASTFEYYTGAIAGPIVGITPIQFVYDSANPAALSPYFTILNGSLQANRKLSTVMDSSFIWTPTIANNEDAGILFAPVIRSGTGTIPINDPYGNIFQSSRANTVDFGASHTLGVADMEAGDVLGVDASDYTGQSGTTTLVRFHLYVAPFV